MTKEDRTYCPFRWTNVLSHSILVETRRVSPKFWSRTNWVLWGLYPPLVGLSMLISTPRILFQNNVRSKTFN